MPSLTKKLAPRIPVALGQTLDIGLGFSITPFSVPGKIPLYMEQKSELALGVQDETTVGLEIEKVCAAKRAPQNDQIHRLAHPGKRNIGAGVHGCEAELGVSGGLEIGEASRNSLVIPDP